MISMFIEFWKVGDREHSWVVSINASIENKVSSIISINNLIYITKRN